MILLPRTAEQWQCLRHLAVARCSQGNSQVDVARFLGVSLRAVQRWLHRYRLQGGDGLHDRHRVGRPPKLSEAQARQVLGWLERSPTEFGFVTERWTAPRLVALIDQFFDISMNARYLSDWLKRRGITPQVPQRRARERNQQVIDDWIARQWPRIKKRRSNVTRGWFSRTKLAFC